MRLQRGGWAEAVAQPAASEPVPTTAGGELEAESQSKVEDTDSDGDGDGEDKL